MLSKIALYNQVIALEEGILDFQPKLQNLPHLIILVDLVPNGYYNGFSSIGATNDEMKYILTRIKQCSKELADICKHFKDDEKEVANLREKMFWLNHAAEEIGRWTAEGRWKDK